MATVILNHRVKDYATWRPLFDSDQARRDAAGIQLLGVGQKAGDPGNVYMVWELADTSIIEKMMADPELQKRMQEGGVISAPEMIILE
jgi:hypothetical protein